MSELVFTVIIFSGTSLIIGFSWGLFLAESQWKKLLAKTNHAIYDSKTGAWRMVSLNDKHEIKNTK